MSGYTECKYCSTEFYAQRSTAKYCSDSCKSLANRKRRADENDYETNQQSMYELNNRMLLRQEEMLKALELKASASAENQYAPHLAQKEEDVSCSDHVTFKSKRSKKKLRFATKNFSAASPVSNKRALIAFGVAGGLLLLNQVLNSSQQPIADKPSVTPENE